MMMMMMMMNLIDNDTILSLLRSVAKLSVSKLLVSNDRTTMELQLNVPR